MDENNIEEKEKAAERIMTESARFCEDYMAEFVTNFSYSQENLADSLRCALRNGYCIPSIFAILEILGRASFLVKTYEEKGKLPKSRAPLDAALKKMVSSVVSKVEQMNMKNEFSEDISLTEISGTLEDIVKHNRKIFFGL